MVVCLRLCKLRLLFCTGFSPAVVNRGYSLVAMRGFLIAVASLVENQGLSGRWAQCLQLPGFRAQAQQLWGMGLGLCGLRDRPGSETEFVPLALAGFCH